NSRLDDSGFDNRFHRRNEPITSLRDGLDKVRVFGGIAKRSPNFVHRDVEAVIEIDEGRIIPKLLGEFVPAYDVGRVFKQNQKEFERLFLQFDPDTITPELACPTIKLKTAKPVSYRVLHLSDSNC